MSAVPLDDEHFVTDVEPWLPHRPPFRLVDDLVSVIGEEAHFTLNLAPADPRLRQGHLEPLYLVEALAQCTAAFNGYTRPDVRESGVLVEFKASFHGAGRGGQQISLHVRRLREHGMLARFAGQASAGGVLLVEAELTVMRDRGESIHD